MTVILIYPRLPKRGRVGQSETGRPRLGFTLIELLVVLATIALLAATLAPTLAGSRMGTEAFRCLNNNRQLCTAWRMYAEDSNDRVVYASDSSASPNGNSKYAWSQAH